MSRQSESLVALRAVIEEQLKLLNITLYVMSEGPVLLEGQWLACVLETDQVRAASAVAMGAGQSLNTIIKNVNERGLAVRDLFPIARGVVEGFVNAAFFMTQPVEVATRALDHRLYAAWKHDHRVIGTGDFMFTLGSIQDPKATAAKLFPAFSGQGKGSWTSLDTPAKINRIGKVVRASGGALLGAYAGIYAASSEIIHGSVYGMSYFMGMHARGSQRVDDFQHGTTEHMIDILSAVSHGISGYLTAFANIHRFGPLVLEEHELFKRMFRAATGDEWVGGDPPTD
ncbi:hypothetical protein [Pseudomonas sp. SIMBA_067]|uniref:hypothetical protein n=1 Tax=Pseudomonas sp. SIMBA_067 TaxID=3085807 RepID=UPI00397AE1CE